MLPGANGRIVCLQSGGPTWGERFGSGSLLCAASEGGGVARLGLPPVDLAWAPDGRIARGPIATTESGIFATDPTGSRVRQIVPAPAGSPTWSPDGRNIAFVTVSDGRLRIEVVADDGAERRRLTSERAAVADPAGSPNGDEIA